MSSLFISWTLISTQYLRSEHSNDTEEINDHENREVGHRQGILDHAHLDVLISIIAVKQKGIFQISLWG